MCIPLLTHKSIVIRNWSFEEVSDSSTGAIFFSIAEIREKNTLYLY